MNKPLIFTVLAFVAIGTGYYYYNKEQVTPDVPVSPDDPSPQPTRPLPGDRVTWSMWPVQRDAPKVESPMLQDVESHLPRSLGNQYRSGDHITWCHETTHGVHSALRNSNGGSPCFYDGRGRYALVAQPKGLRLRDVAAAIPELWRGSRYQLYLVSQAGQWDDSPLYVWDEWVAYVNGLTCGVEEGGRKDMKGLLMDPGGNYWKALRVEAGQTDDAIAVVEFCGYALGVALAAKKKGIILDDQFKEALAYWLRKSLRLYAQAEKLPSFQWHDKKIPAQWFPLTVPIRRALGEVYPDDGDPNIWVWK